MWIEIKFATRPDRTLQELDLIVHDCPSELRLVEINNNKTKTNPLARKRFNDVSSWGWFNCDSLECVYVGLPRLLSSLSSIIEWFEFLLVKNESHYAACLRLPFLCPRLPSFFWKSWKNFSSSGIGFLTSEAYYCRTIRKMSPSLIKMTKLMFVSHWSGDELLCICWILYSWNV